MVLLTDELRDIVTELRPAAIDTYDDRRMAMAFAVVGTRDAECASKTYPRFFEDLESLRS